MKRSVVLQTSVCRGAGPSLQSSCLKTPWYDPKATTFLCCWPLWPSTTQTPARSPAEASAATRLVRWCRAWRNKDWPTRTWLQDLSCRAPPLTDCVWALSSTVWQMLGCGRPSRLTVMETHHNPELFSLHRSRSRCHGPDSVVSLHPSFLRTPPRHRGHDHGHQHGGVILAAQRIVQPRNHNRTGSRVCRLRLGWDFHRVPTSLLRGAELRGQAEHRVAACTKSLQRKNRFFLHFNQWVPSSFLLFYNGFLGQHSSKCSHWRMKSF